MGADSLPKLEVRIETLLRAFNELKSENTRLREELAVMQQTVQEIEGQKHNLSTSIGSLQSDSEARRETLNAAADKLESIIARLGSAG